MGERTLTVAAAKTGRRRTVRFLGPLREDLLAWRMACGRPRATWSSSALVRRCGHEREELERRRGSVFAPALKAAGLPPARPYDARHTFASLLLHEGRSVVYVARQLGHAATLTLTTYGHVVDELEDAPRLSAEAAIRAARTHRMYAPGTHTAP